MLPWPVRTERSSGVVRLRLEDFFRWIPAGVNYWTSQPFPEYLTRQHRSCASGTSLNCCGFLKTIDGLGSILGIPRQIMSALQNAKVSVNLWLVLKTTEFNHPIVTIKYFTTTPSFFGVHWIMKAWLKSSHMSEKPYQIWLNQKCQSVKMILYKGVSTSFFNLFSAKIFNVIIYEKALIMYFHFVDEGKISELPFLLNITCPWFPFLI